MKQASREILESIRQLVIESFNDTDGSIMYIGSKGNIHYFKGKASRRIVEIKY